MADLWWNIALVVVFVLIGGVFATTEMALVTLRESQLNAIAARGRRGAKVAALARNPNTFLSAVQIGVTVAGFASAAYGAASIAPSVTPLLTRLGLAEPVAATMATIGLTLVIAYLSLVLGELVPKRLAIQRNAQFAYAVAPVLDGFAVLMRPVIWLLSVSTNALVRLLGGDPNKTADELSDEEIRDIVTSHQGLPEDERRILDDVLSLRGRQVSEVMRPRPEVVALDDGITVAEAVERIRDLPYSRYPVADTSIDDIVGFVEPIEVLTQKRRRGRDSFLLKDEGLTDCGVERLSRHEALRRRARRPGPTAAQEGGGDRAEADEPVHPQPGLGFRGGDRPRRQRRRRAGRRAPALGPHQARARDGRALPLHDGRDEGGAARGDPRAAVEPRPRRVRNAHSLFL